MQRMKVVENCDSNPHLDCERIGHNSSEQNNIPQFISIQEGQFK